MAREWAGKEMSALRFTLRQARTHAEMAEELGIDRTTYIKIEKDQSRATVRQLYCISRVTGIPVTWFFAESDTMAR